MKLEWKETYSIDNEEIDRQHRRWIDFYNRLDDVMRGEDSGVVRKTKQDILKQMSDYVAYHFEYEEEYMRSIGFPDTEKHWRMHKDFRNEIYRLCRNHDEGTIVLNTEIMDMIKNWLVNHIIQFDMRINEYVQLKEKGDAVIDNTK